MISAVKFFDFLKMLANFNLQQIGLSNKDEKSSRRDKYKKGLQKS
jgi:hypothetical protein